MTQTSCEGHASVLDGAEGLAGRVRALERRVDNLLLALASQRLIGTAVGLLAHRYGCSTGEAWDRLAKMSQDCNVKVRDLARLLVDHHDGTGRPADADLLARLGDRLT